MLYLRIFRIIGGWRWNLFRLLLNVSQERILLNLRSYSDLAGLKSRSHAVTARTWWVVTLGTACWSFLRLSLLNRTHNSFLIVFVRDSEGAKTKLSSWILRNCLATVLILIKSLYFVMIWWRARGNLYIARLLFSYSESSVESLQCAWDIIVVICPLNPSLLQFRTLPPRTLLISL